MKNNLFDSDNKKFYDLNAQKYADEWYANEMMLPSIREFLGLFTQSEPVILDLGCGPGHESGRLQKLGARVTGIDYSGESIAVAKTRNTGIRFLEMSFFDIDSTLGSFDGVFSCSSLIHLQKDELDGVLRRVATVLVPNGIFLTIYRHGTGRITQNHEIQGQKIIRTIEQYQEKELIEIFTQRGFSFLQKGLLDDSLKANWDSLLFRKSE